MTELPRTIQVWATERPGDAPVRLERPTPTLRAHEVLVEVEAAAVAGPELVAFARGTGRAPGGAAVGRVAAAGDAAAHLAGHRVLVGPVQACGECDLCRRGRIAVCPARVRLGIDIDGALATHVVAHGRWVLSLDGALAGVAPGPAAAALPREAALALELVARAGIAPGETTLWLGPGPIARLGLEVARAKGAAAHALTEDELALAPQELAEAVRARLTAAGGFTPPWRVFETSGRAIGRARALALAEAGATVALLGGEAVGARDDESLAVAAALDADATLVGVAAPHPDLLPEVAALVARGELDLASAVEVRPFDRLPDAVAERRRERGDGRLLVVAFG